MAVRKVVPGQAGLPVPNPTASFWHKEPASRLLGHRTTPDLPAAVDVVIVGSGITGAFAAHFLKTGLNGEGGSGNVGESVLMLEAREACWGATGRNGGHCQPIVFLGPASLAAFELANYAFLRKLVRDHAIPCDWVDHPSVRGFLTSDVFEAAAARAETMRTNHPDLAGDLEVVYRRDRKRLAELGVPGVEGVIVQRKAASLWPYKLVAFVLERLLDRFPPEQFNLQTHTPVTNLRACPPEAMGGGLLWRLTTPRGTVRAKKVLLATNAYTSRLLPDVADLIVPVRGQVSALRPPEGGKRLGMSFGFDKEGGDDNGGGECWRHDYLIQRPGDGGCGGGELVFGGGRALAKGMGVGEWRDDEVEEKVARFLRTQLSPPVDFGLEPKPGQTLEAITEWTGIMGYSRDHLPWVGQVPASIGGGEGLFLCAGYSGHGMPNSGLCAHAAVEMMRGLYPGGGGIGYRLPEEYVVTEERIARAKAEISVDQWGDLGCAVDYPELMDMRNTASKADV